MKKFLNTSSGLTMVEVMIATAIILVAVISLISVHSLYLRTALSNTNAIKAAYLAEEGIEILRFMRDDSWNAKISMLVSGTSYGLVFENGIWQANTTGKTVGVFERSVILSDVYRDTNGDIVSVGGSLDPDTRLIISSVSWLSNGTTTKSISTYFTNIWQN